VLAYSFYRHSPEFLLAIVVTVLHWLVWRHLQSQPPRPGQWWRLPLLRAAFAISVLWVWFAVLGNLPSAIRAMPPWASISWIKGVGELWAVTGGGAMALYLILAKVEKRYTPARREFLDVARTAVLASPALFTAYGTSIGRSDYEVKEVDLRIPGLHKDLEGLRILHLSDIHLSPFLSERELARVIDMGNEARARLCLVTGDFITGVGDPLEACMKQLARLRCEAGIYGCNGNHEIFAGAEELARTLGAHSGIRILRQENAVLRFGDGRLNLAGVDYQPFHNPYLLGAEKLKQQDTLNILLSHNPDVFPVAAGQGWDVTLAGHTHGGQITVEILHQYANVARIFTPFVSGKYERDGKSLYVTRGIGTVGVPARVGAPPEVSVIRLCAS